MELRLLLDGGSPPGAPPGITELNLVPGEFAKELTCETEKLATATFAIVEDLGVESNIPLENLDSESETKETEDQTVTPQQLTVESNSLPIWMSQLILGRPETPPAPLPMPIANKQIRAAAVSGNLVSAADNPRDSRKTPIDQPIHKLFDGKVQPEIVAKVEEWAKQFNANEIETVEPELLPFANAQEAKPQFEPEHLEALNITFMSKREILPEEAETAALTMQTEAVEATLQPATPPTPVVTMMATEQKAVAQKVIEGSPAVQGVANNVVKDTEIENTLKPLESKDATQLPTQAEACEVTSNVIAESKGGAATGSFNDGSTDSDASEENAETPVKTDSAEGKPAFQAHQSQATHAVVKTQEPISDRQMSIEDRQKNIDAITRKIEQMAVNSVRNEVRIEMHPPEMGTLSINVKQAMESLSVTLTASNDQVHEALQQSRQDLAASLAVKAKQEVNIQIRSGESQSLPQEQASAQHRQQQPQREDSQPRNFAYETPTPEQNHTPAQTYKVRPNSLINLEI